MITFERTTDYSLVRKITTHPKVWSRITDDFSGRPEDFEPSEDPRNGYVLAKDGDEVLGLYTFCAENAICWYVHTKLLPSTWGRTAEINRALLDWVWMMTKCERLVMNISADNFAALLRAKQAGFEEIGINKKSVMKHGKLLDQILLGISRPSSTGGK